MSYKIDLHRKLPDSTYVLEVAGRTFHWPPAPTGVKAAEYEAQQLREAKLLLDAEQVSEGKKLKSEGRTL